MNLLFWIFWVVDALILLLVIAGSKFRDSFGAGNAFNNLAFVLLIAILIAGLWCRIAVKPRWVSFGIAALPPLLLVLMYLFEKK